ncbi:MAG: hypothetical protein O7A64_04775 [Alphaproteobacteria bacterium]|nr:hypothetical protein [Alphaproteobacteria bacterium]
MLDKIFAAIGMLGVIAFMGVVTAFVMEPDLWIITIIILGVAVSFLWRDLRAGPSHVEGDSGSDDSDG